MVMIFAITDANNKVLRLVTARLRTVQISSVMSNNLQAENLCATECRTTCYSLAFSVIAKEANNFEWPCVILWGKSCHAPY
jgi:hypothetical protein